MITFLILGSIIAGLFYTINVLVYTTSRKTEANSALLATYECGFETIENQSRTEHTFGYYLIALLYVIFDLEIALVLPALISFAQLGIAGAGLLITIMTVLCLGFIYELNLGIFNHAE